jgi:hypothetical protein
MAPDAGVRALAERLQSESQVIDHICEKIEAVFHFSVPLDARAQLMCAQSAVKFWTSADANNHEPGEKRIRTQRFFTFAIMAYEWSNPRRRRAGVTWNAHAERFEGEFYEFAKICSAALLPEKLRPKSDIALGRVIDRAGKRRTADFPPRRSRGRRPTIRGIISWPDYLL